MAHPDRARSLHIAISHGLEVGRHALLTLAVVPAQVSLMGGVGGAVVRHRERRLRRAMSLCTTSTLPQWVVECRVSRCWFLGAEGVTCGTALMAVKSLLWVIAVRGFQY